MKTSPTAVSILTVLLIFCFSACGVNRNDGVETQVDAIFQRYNSRETPGSAVAVVREGKVVFAKGYGMASLEHEVPITPSTVFDIASVSKQFAGLAISTLIEEGKIALDDDIRTYLPEVPDLGKKITIGHLVHHTSGLRDWPQALNVAGWRWDELFSFQDIIRMVKHQEELDFEPGEKYSYSNTGYNLLAAVVEKVSGSTFREWTKANIFEPLDMNSSQFLDDHSRVIPNVAWSYACSDGECRKRNSALTAYGSSSLFTNIEDLAKWVIHFEKQVAEKNPVFLRMLEDGVLSNNEKVGYAFGLGLGEQGGLKTVSHTGGWAGYRTIVLNFPAESLSCILLSNSADFDATGYANKVAKVFLGEKLEVKEEQADAAKEMPVVQVNTSVAEKCAGTYQLGEGWYVTITLENGQLMTQANGESKFPMVAKSDLVYWIDAYGASMTFKKDANGDINSLRYRWIEDAKRVTPLQIDREQFRSYAGRYYSRELGAEYEVMYQDGRLVLKHMRLGDFDLQPDPVSDGVFGCEIAIIRFMKDAQNKISGLTMSGGRVKNLRFTKTG